MTGCLREAASGMRTKRAQANPNAAASGLVGRKNKLVPNKARKSVAAVRTKSKLHKFAVGGDNRTVRELDPSLGRKILHPYKKTQGNNAGRKPESYCWEHEVAPSVGKG